MHKDSWEPSDSTLRTTGSFEPFTHPSSLKTTAKPLGTIRPYDSTVSGWDPKTVWKQWECYQPYLPPLHSHLLRRHNLRGRDQVRTGDDRYDRASAQVQIAHGRSCGEHTRSN